MDSYYEVYDEFNLLSSDMKVMQRGLAHGINTSPGAVLLHPLVD